MLYRPFYTTKATKDLRVIDAHIKQRIVDKIDFYCAQSNPLLFAKKLRGFEGAQYRFRIGDYRALFDADSQGNIIILVILAVRHRREVYN